MSLERFRDALEDISRDVTRTALCIPYYLTERTPLININLARDLWEWYCDGPNPYPEDPVPPFDGGQCEGVLYTLRLQFDLLLDLAGNQRLPRDNTYSGLVGPIGEPFLDTNRENGQLNLIRVPTGAGTLTLEQTTIEPRRFENLSAVSVTREDGLPDDCGDPPPPPPPPIPDPPPFPIPIPPVPVPDPDNPGGPDFIFAPRVGPIFIGPSGEINVPIEVNISGPDVDVNIPVNVSLPDFSPTINIGGGGGGGGDEGPRKPEVPCCEPRPDLPEPPEDEPEPPDEEPPPLAKNTVVRGAIVTVNNIDETAKLTIIGQGFNAPTLYVPRLGNLYFRYEIDDRRYWSGDIPVRVDGQYEPAPLGLKVVGARAVGDPGVDLSASVVTIVDASQS